MAEATSEQGPDVPVGVLAGVTVVEFAQNAAVPHCGRLLAGMGADVVKVEPPAGDAMRGLSQLAPHESKTFATINPGKRGIVLDLGHDDAGPIVERLLAWADVVLVGMKLGDLERFGLDWERVRSVNPRAIQLVVTALGPDGPDASLPGYDVLVQARSGIGFVMNRSEHGRPVPTRPAMFDFATGFAGALGVVAALRQREQTGAGQRVDASLLGTALSLATPLVHRFERVDAGPLAELDVTMAELRSRGADIDQQRAAYESRVLPGAAAFRLYFRFYATADGMISVGAMSQSLFERFHTATGLPPVNLREPDSPAFDEVVSSAEELFAGRDTESWLAALRAAGVPCSRYVLPHEAVDDAQARANDYVVELEHPAFGRYTTSGTPLRFGATPNAELCPSPQLGEHTEEVFAQIGCSSDEVAAWRRTGVLGAT